MNFFINAISKKGVLILFDDNRHIVDKQEIDILGKESEKLVYIIDDFLKKNDLKYFDIENLVVVNGPGSFTGVRTVVLIINTINFVIGKKITTLSFFDLFDNYPIVKSSSKRDLFVKLDKKSNIKIINNDDFIDFFKKESLEKVYGDLSTSNIPNISLSESIDYNNILKNLEFQKTNLATPLYIKKPNIT